MDLGAQWWTGGTISILTEVDTTLLGYKAVSSMVFNTDYTTTVVNYTTGVEWTVHSG